MFALLLAGCYSFAGGGLPSHIKSVAVIPFDNETSASMLQGELTTQMRREVQGRLGLREANQNNANALVRGRIVRYEADIPVAYSADPTQSTSSAQRKVQITVDVEIVDQSTGRMLWSQKGLTRDGTYAEGAEDSGRRQAIEKIVNDVVAGAQSQW
jgi:hypothetical protein